MAVDGELVTWLRENREDPESSPFETTAEVIGWAAASARAEACDEVAEIETLLIAADFYREELRHDARILRRLGYAGVATAMQRIARRAEPKPSHWRDLSRVPATAIKSWALTPSGEGPGRRLNKL